MYTTFLNLFYYLINLNYNLLIYLKTRELESETLILFHDLLLAETHMRQTPVYQHFYCPIVSKINILQ